MPPKRESLPRNAKKKKAVTTSTPTTVRRRSPRATPKSATVRRRRSHATPKPPTPAPPAETPGPVAGISDHPWAKDLKATIKPKLNDDGVLYLSTFAEGLIQARNQGHDEALEYLSSNDMEAPEEVTQLAAFKDWLRQLTRQTSQTVHPTEKRAVERYVRRQVKSENKKIQSAVIKAMERTHKNDANTVNNVLNNMTTRHGDSVDNLIRTFSGGDSSDSATAGRHHSIWKLALVSVLFATGAFILVQMEKNGQLAQYLPSSVSKFLGLKKSTTFVEKLNEWSQALWGGEEEM